MIVNELDRVLIWPEIGGWVAEAWTRIRSLSRLVSAVHNDLGRLVVSAAVCHAQIY